MGLSAGAGREFWRGVLVAGGFTTIPRWTLEQATASPSTRRRSLTTLPRPCAGWPTSWRCR